VINEQESFSLLAGVLLTDQSETQTGNLWVWPGSHLAHSRLFHERGTDALRATWGHVTMLDPPFPIGDPVEVRGRRGDLLLAHFLTGHNGGGNTGNQVRRTIYYRLATPGHATPLGGHVPRPASRVRTSACRLVLAYAVSDARLVLTCGLPGAGKTVLATRLAAERSAVRLTKDEWLWARGASPGIDLRGRESNMSSGAWPRRS